MEYGEAVKAALGGDYDTYMDWLDSVTMQSFFQKFTPEQFREKLLALDYKPESISEFRQFLDKPKVLPIVIGRMGSEVLQLAPESGQLEYHEEDEDSPSRDERPALDSVILGLWSQMQDFRNGNHSDEGYASGGPTQSTTTAIAPLEAFLQLGLLYSRPESSITKKTNLNSGSDWYSTNYVLVVNIHDDSIWVLWKKYILGQETAEYELAKDVWPGRYAMFPGMPMDEAVIYARLADSWDDLNPSITTSLRLAMIVRAPSAQNEIEEPILVTARRTAQGGIRRDNDFRSMKPK